MSVFKGFWFIIKKLWYWAFIGGAIATLLCLLINKTIYAEDLQWILFGFFGLFVLVYFIRLKKLNKELHDR